MRAPTLRTLAAHAVARSLRRSPTLADAIALLSLAFALAMGFVGGFLPAARAARMKIVDALRAA